MPSSPWIPGRKQRELDVHVQRRSIVHVQTVTAVHRVRNLLAETFAPVSVGRRRICVARKGALFGRVPALQQLTAIDRVVRSRISTCASLTTSGVRQLQPLSPKPSGWRRQISATFCISSRVGRRPPTGVAGQEQSSNNFRAPTTAPLSRAGGQGNENRTILEKLCDDPWKKPPLSGSQSRQPTALKFKRVCTKRNGAQGRNRTPTLRFSIGARSRCHHRSLQPHLPLVRSRPLGLALWCPGDGARTRTRSAKRVLAGSHLDGIFTQHEPQNLPSSRSSASSDRFSANSSASTSLFNSISDMGSSRWLQFPLPAVKVCAIYRDKKRRIGVLHAGFGAPHGG